MLPYVSHFFLLLKVRIIDLFNAEELVSVPVREVMG